MSALHMPERPVFNSLEPGLDSDLTPPISSLAVLALVLGVLSLTAAMAISIVPFAIVVAIFCAVLTWKLSWDSSVSGLRLAQIGLCCAVLGCTWGLTATRLQEAYYYSQASEHAKLFLETLSAGKKYEAFELTQPESYRQITGTDLDAHYNVLMKTPMPVRRETSMPSDMPSAETMKSSHSKEELEEFLNSVGTQEVMSHGKDAKWEFVRGVEVLRMSNTANRIAVLMVDSLDPSRKFLVSINRELGRYVSKPGQGEVAIWDVDRVKVVKE